MEPIRKTIERIGRSVQSSEEWIELIRDLRESVTFLGVPFDFRMRWAEKGDLKTINALEGYVKEVKILESSMENGDTCLVFEKDDIIEAFAWVTFRNYPLNIWHTLRLPTGHAYLVYIYVRPEYRNQKVGTCLLGCLIKALHERGYTNLISGMYNNWEISLRLHYKQGFKILRKYTERKILKFISFPPKKQNFEAVCF